MRTTNKGTIRTIGGYVLDANVPYGGDGWFVTKSGNTYILSVTDPLKKAIMSVEVTSQSGSSIVAANSSTPTSGSFSLINFSSSTGVSQLANFHFILTYRV